MPTINNSYFYTDNHANDNAIVMIPMFDGFSFQGYQVVKGNWRCPEVFEVQN